MAAYARYHHLERGPPVLHAELLGISIIVVRTCHEIYKTNGRTLVSSSTFHISLGPTVIVVVAGRTGRPRAPGAMETKVNVRMKKEIRRNVQRMFYFGLVDPVRTNQLRVLGRPMGLGSKS